MLYGYRFKLLLQAVILLPVAILMVPLAVATEGAAAEVLYSIEVSKSKRELRVMRLGREVRKYHIASGSEDGNKLRRGDKRTPVGRYTVREVRPSNSYHIFMHLDYPGMHDAIAAYDTGRIDAVEYNAFRMAHARGKMPPQDTLLGGQIGIHGLGKAELGSHHILYNWTKGCIAVDDSVIEELKKHYIVPGTVVTISE